MTAETLEGVLPQPEIDLDDPRLYLNRELSWLEFNERVFEEARSHRNRLIERVKFLAITASNLDEFAAKRVGWLKRVLKHEPRNRTVDGRTIAEQLDLVIRALRADAARDGRIVVGGAFTGAGSSRHPNLALR